MSNIQYEHLADMPRDELAARVVSTLIMAKGHVNKWHAIIRALADGLLAPRDGDIEPICMACNGSGGLTPYSGENELCPGCTGTGKATRVYIAGPIGDRPDRNAPAFNAAATLYRSRGCVVMNPIELVPEGSTRRQAMQIDLDALITCDMIVMLDGWTESRGACLEHNVARGLDMAVVYPA